MWAKLTLKDEDGYEAEVVAMAKFNDTVLLFSEDRTYMWRRDKAVLKELSGAPFPSNEQLSSCTG